MTKSEAEKPADQRISKVKLAIGAASLFLFIIGVKRTFQMEHHEATPPDSSRAGSGEAAEPRRSRRRGEKKEKKKEEK